MQKKKIGSLHIGTSGWVYPHWESVFYPENLSSEEKLKYFAKNFKTTEVNYSFYHLPKLATYEKWRKSTPQNFIFAVKVSRFITHIKRFKEVNEAWQLFLKNALGLREKLGPFLFQFPPSFKATSENVKRVERFLDYFVIFEKRFDLPLRFAFEFRDKSWCQEKVYKLLKEHNVAWVIADSPRFPKAETITSNFAYIRMHGSKRMFSSNYSRSELEDLAQKVKKWQKDGNDIYVYFNNDFAGYAVKNAKTLIKLCS